MKAQSNLETSLFREVFNLKKFFLILTLLISFNLSAKFLENIRLTFSQSAKQSTNSFDYDFIFELEYQDYAQIEIETKRINDLIFYNHSIKLFQEKEFWQIHAFWKEIGVYDLDLKQIDLRGTYKNWSMGIAQTWANRKPKTKLILGKKVDFDYKIMRFSYIQDVLTSNFKKWEYDTLVKAGIEIYIFEFGLKLNFLKVMELDWSERIYVKFKF